MGKAWLPSRRVDVVFLVFRIGDEDIVVMEKEQAERLGKERKSTRQVDPDDCTVDHLGGGLF